MKSHASQNEKTLKTSCNNLKKKYKIKNSRIQIQKDNQKNKSNQMQKENLKKTNLNILESPPIEELHIVVRL